VDEMLAAETQTRSASQESPDLAGFATRVLAAAQTSPTGRFGDRKVFISHVMHHLGVHDETTFKQRLVDAHQAGLLTLGRADLVDAMDPEDVARSETHHTNSTYHFVRLG
jgi:hypothetical protein